MVVTESLNLFETPKVFATGGITKEDQSRITIGSGDGGTEVMVSPDEGTLSVDQGS